MVGYTRPYKHTVKQKQVTCGATDMRNQSNPENHATIPYLKAILVHIPTTPDTHPCHDNEHSRAERLVAQRTHRFGLHPSLDQIKGLKENCATSSANGARHEGRGSAVGLEHHLARLGS